MVCSNAYYNYGFAIICNIEIKRKLEKERADTERYTQREVWVGPKGDLCVEFFYTIFCFCLFVGGGGIVEYIICT